MKVVVVGSGGREHALAAGAGPHRRGASSRPGNPGIPGSVATPVEELWPTRDLVVIGPEEPLVDGLADRLRADGRAGVRARAPTAPSSRARRRG